MERGQPGMKEKIVKNGIKRLLEDVNEGKPHGVSELRRELHNVLGIEVAWGTVKKYADELADEGKIRRKKLKSPEYEKVAYLG